jgi:hypothetical protein
VAKPHVAERQSQPVEVEEPQPTEPDYEALAQRVVAGEFGNGRVWAMLPAWCELAFRLDNTDRPDFSNGLMMDMSPAEITETWENLPDYNYWPVYYTEADREGRV